MERPNNSPVSSSKLPPAAVVAVCATASDWQALAADLNRVFLQTHPTGEVLEQGLVRPPGQIPAHIIGSDGLLNPECDPAEVWQELATLEKICALGRALTLPGLCSFVPALARVDALTYEQGEAFENRIAEKILGTTACRQLTPQRILRMLFFASFAKIHETMLTQNLGLLLITDNKKEVLKADQWLAKLIKVFFEIEQIVEENHLHMLPGYASKIDYQISLFTQSLNQLKECGAEIQSCTEILQLFYEAAQHPIQLMACLCSPIESRFRRLQASGQDVRNYLQVSKEAFEELDFFSTAWEVQGDCFLDFLNKYVQKDNRVAQKDFEALQEQFKGLIKFCKDLEKNLSKAYFHIQSSCNTLTQNAEKAINDLKETRDSISHGYMIELQTQYDSFVDKNTAFWEKHGKKSHNRKHIIQFHSSLHRPFFYYQVLGQSVRTSLDQICVSMSFLYERLSSCLNLKYKTLHSPYATVIDVLHYQAEAVYMRFKEKIEAGLENGEETRPLILDIHSDFNRIFFNIRALCSMQRQGHVTESAQLLASMGGSHTAEESMKKAKLAALNLSKDQESQELLRSLYHLAQMLNIALAQEERWPLFLIKNPFRALNLTDALERDFFFDLFLTVRSSFLEQDPQEVKLVLGFVPQKPLEQEQDLFNRGVATLLKCANLYDKMRKEVELEAVPTLRYFEWHANHFFDRLVKLQHDIERESEHVLEMLTEHLESHPDSSNEIKHLRLLIEKTAVAILEMPCFSPGQNLIRYLNARALMEEPVAPPALQAGPATETVPAAAQPLGTVSTTVLISQPDVHALPPPSHQLVESFQKLKRLCHYFHHCCFGMQRDSSLQTLEQSTVASLLHVLAPLEEKVLTVSTQGLRTHVLADLFLNTALLSEQTGKLIATQFNISAGKGSKMHVLLQGLGIACFWESHDPLIYPLLFEERQPVKGKKFSLDPIHRKQLEKLQKVLAISGRYLIGNDELCRLSKRFEEVRAENMKALYLTHMEKFLLTGMETCSAMLAYAAQGQDLDFKLPDSHIAIDRILATPAMPPQLFNEGFRQGAENAIEAIQSTLNNIARLRSSYDQRRVVGEQQAANRVGTITEMLRIFQANLPRLRSLLCHAPLHQDFLTAGRQSLLTEAALWEAALLLLLSHLLVAAEKDPARHYLWPEERKPLRYRHRLSELAETLRGALHEQGIEVPSHVLDDVLERSLYLEEYIKQAYRYSVSNDEPVVQTLARWEQCAHLKGNISHLTFKQQRELDGFLKLDAANREAGYQNFLEQMMHHEMQVPLYESLVAFDKLLQVYEELLK